MKNIFPFSKCQEWQDDCLRRGKLNVGDAYFLNGIKYLIVKKNIWKNLAHEHTHEYDLLLDCHLKTGLSCSFNIIPRPIDFTNREDPSGQDQGINREYRINFIKSCEKFRFYKLGLNKKEN